MSVPVIPLAHIEAIFGIPTIEPVTVQVRPLNERLLALAAKEADGNATAAEVLELDVLCAALEAEQDNLP